MDKNLNVKFSRPYFYDNMVVLLKQNNSFSESTNISDLEGGSCTSVFGSVAYNECLPQINNADIHNAIESTIQLFDYLENENCDFIVTTLSSALVGCSLYSDFKILDFTDTDDNFQISERLTDLSISINKDNLTLLNDINDALELLSYNEMKDMMSNAINSQIDLNIDIY